jgi:hypothetical protein
MNSHLLEVGQVVKHSGGFEGEIIQMNGTGEYADVEIKVTDSGSSHYEVGYEYSAFAKYVLEIVKPAPHKRKLTAEVEMEFTGIEKLEELVGQASEALEILSDTTPFKVTIDSIVFEGTPAQFEAFMATMDKYKVN